MNTPFQATLTDVHVNTRSIAADWTVTVTLNNTLGDAAWFILPDAFDVQALEGKASKASGFKLFHAPGLSPVPVVELVSTPSLYAMYMPAGAGVTLEGLTLRKSDANLPTTLHVWTAEDIYVLGGSIHDTWLPGLSVHTPPRKTKADASKWALQKKQLNKNFVSEQLSFEELKRHEIAIESGSMTLPESIKRTP